MSKRKTSKVSHVYTGKPIPFNERESNGVKYWNTRSGRAVGHDVTITLSSDYAVTCVNSPYLATRKGV